MRWQMGGQVVRAATACMSTERWLLSFLGFFSCWWVKDAWLGSFGGLFYVFFWNQPDLSWLSMAWRMEKCRQKRFDQ